MKCKRNLPSEESHSLHLTLTSSASSFYSCISPRSERKHEFTFSMKLSRLQYELYKDILVSKLSKRNKQMRMWSFSERRHGSAERSYSKCPVYLRLHRSSLPALRSSQSSALHGVCPARSHPHFVTLPYLLFPSVALISASWYKPRATVVWITHLGPPFSYDLTLIHDPWLLMSLTLGLTPISVDRKLSCHQL